MSEPTTSTSGPEAALAGSSAMTDWVSIWPTVG
jgi:hypothetical protein